MDAEQSYGATQEDGQRPGPSSRIEQSLDGRRDQSVVGRKSQEQTLRRDELILQELQRLYSSMGEIQARVRRLESSHTRDLLPPSTKKRRVTELYTPTTSWADRDPEPEGSNSEDEDQDIALSERSVALFSSTFSSTLSNTERWRVRNSFPIPSVSETRCPRLDPIFKTSAKLEARTADAELARIQAFVLDPVGPLARVLHAMEDSGDNITMEEAQSALCDVVKLLGNASYQISKLRRRKILKAVNPDIQDLAEEDIFHGAAPDLFGQGFEAKMKERAESLKLIAAAKNPAGPKKFFRGGHPFGPQRGGGQASRGGRNWWRRKTDNPGKHRKYLP